MEREREEERDRDRERQRETDRDREGRGRVGKSCSRLSVRMAVTVCGRGDDVEDGMWRTHGRGTRGRGAIGGGTHGTGADAPKGHGYSLVLPIVLEYFSLCHLTRYNHISHLM